MSQENVDIVKNVSESINRRDSNAWAEPLHPDVEWRSGAHGRVVRGRDGFVAGLKEFLSGWDEYTETPEEILDLGEDVVVLMRVEARSSVSGMTLQEGHGEIHTFRDGRIIRIVQYESHEATLKAAGLLE